MSVVWSCNEWDPLEEIIVGNPLGARFPAPDRSTQLAEFPDRSLKEIPQGPFPQQIIEETEEDLNAFIAILEKLGSTVSFGATVMGGAVIEPETTLLPLSMVLKERHLPTGTYWGSPTEPVR